MSEFPRFIQYAQDRLNETLPGPEAHLEMGIKNRPVEFPDSQTARPAGVLISLFERSGEWHTVVIRRKEKANDRHSGQISFPGGRVEPGETPVEAALRESHEEIATPLEGVPVIGHLTPLHVPVSNFLIYPTVSFLAEPKGFRPQESEVDAIFELRLQDLFDPANRGQTDITTYSGFVLRDVPHFFVEGQIIWGATAMIMSEFLAVIGKDSQVNSLISPDSPAIRRYSNS